MATYTDNFDRANEDPLAGSFTTQTANAPRIVGNLVTHNAAFDHCASYHSGSVSTAQRASVVLAGALETNVTSPEYGAGPAIFMGTGGAVTKYMGVARTGQILLTKWDSGNFGTQLGSTYSGTVALTDEIEIQGEVVGSDTVLRVYQNGVLRVSHTDTSSPYTAGSVGLFVQAADVSGVGLDDWSGGDIDSSTNEQEGFRFRNDDGSETTATWKAAQDTNVTAPLTTNARLRMLINAVLDPPTVQFRLDYKKSTDSVYVPVLTAQPAATIPAAQDVSAIGASTAGTFTITGEAFADSTFVNAAQLTVTGGNLTGITTLTNTGTIDIAATRTLSAGVILNNAGTIKRKPAAEHPDEFWDDVLEINLSAQFILSREIGRDMVARGAGKIIFTASLLTFQGGITVPGYAASKGGVGQLTKALANEWAGKGVNVNAIAPGYISTDNTEALRADPVRSKSILDRIPAGRWGEPADFKGPTLFLASSASDYVHGTVLLVDGGWMGR